MTAIFMARVGDAIVAAADGAFYNSDGRLSHVASKFTLMPENECIITLQGPFFYHSELRGNLLPNGGGFDEVLRRIVDVVRSIHGRYDNSYGFSRAFIMLVGGYSVERARWESYWLKSEPQDEESTWPPPFEPWTLSPAYATAWTPGYGLEAACAAGIDPEKSLNEQGMDVSEIALRTICAARCSPIHINGAPENATCQVGGFIQFARLERGQLWTSMAHHWPDQIGKILDPTVGDLLPAYLTRVAEPESA